MIATNLLLKFSTKFAQMQRGIFFTDAISCSSLCLIRGLYHQLSTLWILLNEHTIRNKNGGYLQNSRLRDFATTFGWRCDTAPEFWALLLGLQMD